MAVVDEERVGQRVGAEELLGRAHRLGRDGQDLGSQGGEALVVVTQLREMPAAERSEEAAEERQHDRAPAEVGKRDAVAADLRKREVGRRRTLGRGATPDGHERRR